MGETFDTFFAKLIRYAFYLLFVLTPIAFTSNTSELFEFNKMWVVFALTIDIVTLWVGRMIIQKRLFIQTTPLDIPILLFLSSQAIATVHSLDSYVSLWGYYSRFNGGFYSLLSYVLLYYAFVSNIVFSVEKPPLSKKLPHQKHVILSPASLFSFVRTSITISLLLGIFVALWGLPSHFGYDPTCLLFRGNLDVSCWTNQFQPKVRIFSTLGQPNWLAAYLSALFPIAIALAFEKATASKTSAKHSLFSILFYLSASLLFYIDILFTGSRSGLLGLGVSFLCFIALFLLKTNLSTLLKLSIGGTGLFFLLFWVIYEGKQTHMAGLLSLFFLFLFLLLLFLSISKLRNISKTPLFITLILLLVVSVLFGTPATPKLSDLLRHQESKPAETILSTVLEGGGTESGDIRKIVWSGAIDIWKHNPLVGTGVETFAFAYYRYRPTAHNLTSEWDYLYNKAHNEYLNYLATTGAFGLGSYLLLIAALFFLTLKTFFTTSKLEPNETLVIGMLSGFLAMLVSNFFGFSVVIINLFFFLFIAWTQILQRKIKPDGLVSFPTKTQSLIASYTTPVRIRFLPIVVIVLCALFLEGTLLRYYQADVSYAYGYNLDQANQYQTAYQYLVQAAILRPNEPTFRDELSINNAILAESFAYQKDATTAAHLAKNAQSLSDEVASSHPNNVVYWKTRVRVFYALSQIDPAYLTEALKAIKVAHILAPTDAKIAYNLGILSGQTGDRNMAIQTLQETIVLKPDYRDAYYALGLFYREEAVDKNDKVINPLMEEKAVTQLRYILDHFATNDAEALKSLKDWGEM